MAKINTDHVFPEKNPRKPRILVAPLDWGLGHATRCIPVIYELLPLAEVWLAGEGAQEALLRAEFPSLPLLPLEGYRVRYGRSSLGLVSKIFLQGPRLWRTIKKEHEWLKKAVREYDFDGVISDNRFGLYHETVPSIFISHQLMIKNPWGGSSSFWQKQNYRFLNRFSECWVPDLERIPNLAGELSHPRQMPAIPVHYTGLLSRLKKTGTPEQDRHLFISLSGPEPQRTMLENIIVEEIGYYNGTATIVRGIPSQRSLIPSTNDIRFYNHLPTTEYSNEMERAAFVISRSGYSTVMDLVKLGKKSILIPTPGQPEQEYLAGYLRQQGIAYSVTQKNFSLKNALAGAAMFDYQHPDSPDTSCLRDTVQSFIQKLSAPAFG